MTELENKEIERRFREKSEQIVNDAEKELKELKEEIERIEEDKKKE